MGSPGSNAVPRGSSTRIPASASASRVRVSCLRAATSSSNRCASRHRPVTVSVSIRSSSAGSADVVTTTPPPRLVRLRGGVPQKHRQLAPQRGRLLRGPLRHGQGLFDLVEPLPLQRPEMFPFPQQLGTDPLPVALQIGQLPL